MQLWVFHFLIISHSFLVWFGLAAFCLICFIYGVLCQLYLDKICDNLLSYHYITGLSSLQIYWVLLARLEHGHRIFSTYFMLRHLLTCNRIMNNSFTSFLSLSFPHLPLCCKSLPSVIYKTMFPMIWFCPKHSRRPWPTTDALICFWMKEFRLWICPFHVHIAWNLLDSIE